MVGGNLFRLVGPHDRPMKEDDEVADTEDPQALLAEVVEEALNVGAALGVLTGDGGAGATGLVAAKADERLARLFSEYGEAEQRRIEAVVRMCDLMLQLQEFFPNVKWPLDSHWWDEKHRQLHRLKAEVGATTIKRVREIRPE